jgi:hypothetical protein
VKAIPDKITFVQVREEMAAFYGDYLAFFRLQAFDRRL